MASSDRTTEFVELLLRNERRIYAFIRSLVLNRSDAEDLLQDTSKVLWEKFEQYELDSDFAAWAHKIAHYEILRYRRQQHSARLVFSQELIEQLVDRTSLEPARADRMKDFLAECVAELEQRDRELLEQRYEPAASVAKIATLLHCPVQTVYSRLKRTRRVVFECVQRKLREEAHS